ncbi:MAG: acyl-CoA dehydrogenase family protein [Gammaproteobacteria bacterium]
MDFRNDASQTALLDILREVLARHAGAAGAGFDAGLFGALRDAGLLDTAAGGSAALGAVLLTEAIGASDVLQPFGAQALVGPLFGTASAGGPLAVCVDGRAAPVRHGGDAAAVAVIGTREAVLYRARPAQAQPVAANYVYPLARPAWDHDNALARAPAAAAWRCWRLAIAAETVGTMDAALQKVVAYVSGRKQFGLALGAFQGLQHRLAEHAVAIESARWLVREAAWLEDDLSAASAAAFTAATAHRFCFDAHQLCGARGFIHEFGLYRWTLRMKFLSQEGGGEREHAAAAAALRWAV